MVKEMKQHAEYVKKRLQEKGEDGRAELFLYHCTRVHDFQHERLVHLMVTMLVAVITVATVYVTFLLPAPVLFVLDIVLLPLLFAYILHYRALENGVQDLYRLTETLGT